MNLDSNYIKTEAGKPCYWLNDGVFNLPEWTRAMMQIAADRAGSKINSMKRDLDACRPYLKEGETPAECLARNRMDIGRLMGFLATEKAARDTLQEDAARYRWLRMNRLWLKANLPMLHVGEFDAAIDKARAAHEVAG